MISSKQQDLALFLDKVMDKSVQDGLVSERLPDGTYIQQYYYWAFGILIDGTYRVFNIFQDFLEKEIYINEDYGSGLLQEFEELMEEGEEFNIRDYVSNLTKDEIKFFSENETEIK